MASPPVFLHTQSAPQVPSFRTQINDPVGIFDHLQVMLDDQDGMALSPAGTQRMTATVKYHAYASPVVGSSKMNSTFSSSDSLLRKIGQFDTLTLTTAQCAG